MNFGSRFTEFGMTGAFFWIGQLLVLVNIDNTSAGDFISYWANLSNEFYETIPEAFRDSTTTLLTTFGVIGIFVTGLILDLISAPYTLFENILLNRHIKKNNGWLEPLFKNFSREIHAIYQELLKAFYKPLAFSPANYVSRIKLIGPCKRIQSFLFSFIHIFSSNSTSNILTDNMHLWRTSRAISSTLLILAVEILLLQKGIGEISFFAILFYTTLMLLAFSLTGISYNRMCHSLFTLACVTQKKHELEKTKVK